VSASLLAVPVLGVIPTSTEWLAIAVIVLGVLFAARPSPQSLQPASPKR
jgi:drug/metabolite transporter (DMT)-like permease